jgi:hypothetical protein
MVRYRKSASALVVGIYLLWQLAAICHICLIPHELGFSGAYVHVPVDSHTRSLSGEDTESAECLFLVALTSARTEAEWNVDAFVGAAPLESSLVPAGTDTALNKQEIFRLSPANSPPPVR